MAFETNGATKMSNFVDWNFLDWSADTWVTRRDRPHIGQSALTFVTFRLNDSMPRAVLEQWRRDQSIWLNDHGLEKLEIEEAMRRGSLPEILRRQFLKMRDQGWHEKLD